MPHHRLLLAGGAAAVGVLVLLGALGPGPTGATGLSAALTADGGAYVVASGPGMLTVTNTRSGSNRREVHWAGNQPEVADSTACATWRSGRGLSQNGIAFRISREGRHWRAVVLERNVYGREFTLFKVVQFDGDQLRVDPAAVDLAPYLSGPDGAPVFPLHVCARLSGKQLDFAVARDGEPMAPLGTAGRGGRFTLDDALPPRGATGTYVAHVPTGATVRVDGITLGSASGPLPGPPPAAP